jgi:5-methylcytosine-specific restriction endonuclease McrA
VFGPKQSYNRNQAGKNCHVLARVAGGLTVAENLVPACQRCNGAKSSADWRKRFAEQQWHCIKRAARIAWGTVGYLSFISALVGDG